MTTKPTTVRTRFAPSPTGLLHIGGARSALFNWLFARKMGGAFIVRIEDTDRARSKPEYERDIIDGLQWLGLAWDEGPFRQSERMDGYQQYLAFLLENDLAYFCCCAEETLEAEREAARRAGRPLVYGGACRSLAPAEARHRASKGEPCVIRFKMPATNVAFEDLIRGTIAFDAAALGDFVIAKYPAAPLYNFAAVVDDYEMRISHVIRGEDHLANTPKQIMLAQALGFPTPAFAHLPLILNPDRSKMSKRFEATAVAEYRAAGYLPDALVNFLALLGWHPKGDREIFSREELIKEFDLSRVQKAGAAFDVKKLNWMNGQYLRRADDGALLRLLHREATEQNKKIIALVKERMETLSDFNGLAGFLYELPEYPSALLIWKTTPQRAIKANLEAARQAIERGEPLEPLAKKLGAGELLWPLRVALSGLKASPGPYAIMDALGKEETLRRIEIAVQKLA